jgi:hypothetical protein
MLSIGCRDTGAGALGCDYVAKGETEEEDITSQFKYYYKHQLSGSSSTTRILFTDRSLSLILSTAMLAGVVLFSILAHSARRCYSIQSYPDNR